MTDFKFNCPHCQQTLEAPEDMKGMDVDCPACNKPIRLKVQESLDLGKAVPYAAPPPLPPSSISNREVIPATTMPASTIVIGEEVNAESKKGIDLVQKGQSVIGGMFDKLKKIAEQPQFRGSCSLCSARLKLHEQSTKIGMCSLCMLRSANLLQDNKENVDISLGASYREGYPARPAEAKSAGVLYICSNHICFIDNAMKWIVAWEQVIKTDLDYFKASSLRAVLASGSVARQLQQIRNYFCVTYVDSQSNEWTVKFQIHGGALTIPGEEGKAVEVLGYANKYKSRFDRALSQGSKGQVLEQSAASQVDPLLQLQKLADLKAQGILSEEEFAEKKKVLLAKV